MSEPTTETTEPAGDPATGATAETEPAATDPAEPDDRGPGAEAARYRRRLRETEAERDGLAGRVEAMQRREVERIAGEKLAAVRDVWIDGADLAGLLDENGEIDLSLVEARLGAIVAERPGLAKPQKTMGPPSWVQGGNANFEDTGGSSWSDVVKGR